MNLLSGSLILVLAACTNDPARCSESSIPGVSLQGPHLPVTGDTVVTGTFLGDASLVTTVVIAGIPASKVGHDFSSFSATVPLANLQALADDQVHATVTVEVATACGTNASTPDGGTLNISLRRATGLSLKLDDAARVPQNTFAPSKLTLTANREAIGLPLTIIATQGTATGPATIPDDGMGGATVSVPIYFVPSDSGQGVAIVTAMVGDLVTSDDELTVIGPPVFSLPNLSSIARGLDLPVQILNATSAQDISGCAATNVSNTIEALNAGTPLGDTPSPVTQLNAGHPVLHIKVFPGAAVGDAIVIDCIDKFGQSSAVTYTAS